jgi:hypothetical protein
MAAFMVALRKNRRRRIGLAGITGETNIGLPTAVSTASGSKGMSHSIRRNIRLETPGERLKVAEM